SIDLLFFSYTMLLDYHQDETHDLLFFFSSRRRHTRFSRDWSSDVCSSDLAGGAAAPQARLVLHVVDDERADVHDLRHHQPVQERSEERRVGKECSFWRTPCYWTIIRMKNMTY